MTAVRATFAGLPASFSRSWQDLRSGLKRTATSAGMKRAFRTLARPPANEGATGPASGLTRDRGKACESAGLPGVKLPELGHVDEPGKGRKLRDARDADENVEAPRQLGFCPDSSQAPGVELPDLPPDLSQPARTLAPKQGQGSRLGPIHRPIHRRSPVLDQRSAGDVQVLQSAGRLAAGRACGTIGKRAHSREQRRVAPIGARRPAASANRRAWRGLTFTSGTPAAASARSKGPAAGSGRLEDQPRGGRADPGEQRAEAAPVSVEPGPCAILEAMNVESRFRDIHADRMIRRLFHASACRPGLSPGHPSRPKEKTRAIKP